MCQSASSVRFTPEDRAVLARLCEMTGLDSHAAAMPLAVREAVAMLEGFAAKKKGGKQEEGCCTRDGFCWRNRIGCNGSEPYHSQSMRGKFIPVGSSHIT